MADGGIATGMTTATGELVWQERVGGSFSTSLVAAAGRIYFVGDNGETSVVAAGPEFKAPAKNPISENL